MPRQVIVILLLAAVMGQVARPVDGRSLTTAAKSSRVAAPVIPKPPVSLPTTGPAATVLKPLTELKPLETNPFPQLLSEDIDVGRLNGTQQICVARALNRILPIFSQCGGAGSNCTAWGPKETHCLDAPFFDWACDANLTCQKQGNKSFYYQCLPDPQAGASTDNQMQKAFGMNGTMGGLPAIQAVTFINKTLVWANLTKPQQMAVSGCLPGFKPLEPPASNSSKVLLPFDMCGGSAPQLCARYGPSETHCQDAKFPDKVCPQETPECVRQNNFFWQCLPKKE